VRLPEITGHTTSPRYGLGKRRKQVKRGRKEEKKGK
jgi:hypothetical protein